MTRDYLLRITAEFTENSPTNLFQPSALDGETRGKLPEGFDERECSYSPQGLGSFAWPA
jgi:hypothetical protein